MPIYSTVPTGYTLEHKQTKLHTLEVYPRRHLLCLKPHYTCNHTLLTKADILLVHTNGPANPNKTNRRYSYYVSVYYVTLHKTSQKIYNFSWRRCLPHHNHQMDHLHL